MSNRMLIIIPAYNEEKALPGVIKAINTFSPDSDILVVNDASSDGTALVAREMSKAFNVKVINLFYNLGIGGAMQTGFQYAVKNGYKVALQIDGDGQHPAKFIKDLKDAVEKEGVDLAIGSRFVKDTGFKWFFLRRLGISYFSVLIRLLTGIKVHDVTSGFRAFSKNAINIFAKYYPHDYPEVESLVVSKKSGLKVEERPIMLRRRKHGMSTINWLDGIHYMIRVTLGVFVSSLRSFKNGGEIC